MRLKQLVTFRMGKAKAADRGEKHNHEDQESVEKTLAQSKSKCSGSDLLHLVDKVFLQKKEVVHGHPARAESSLSE